MPSTGLANGDSPVSVSRRLGIREGGQIHYSRREDWLIEVLGFPFTYHSQAGF